jgi:F0F1-type ATP synthase membrane subunit b/b'
VIIAIIFLWFTLAFLFKPIGKFISRLIEDVKEEMSLDEKEK